MSDYQRAVKLLGQDNRYTQSLEVFEGDLLSFCQKYFEVESLNMRLIPCEKGVKIQIILKASKGKNYTVLR